MKRPLLLILLIALFLVACTPAATPIAAQTQPPATNEPTAVPTDFRPPPRRNREHSTYLQPPRSQMHSLKSARTLKRQTRA